MSNHTVDCEYCGKDQRRYYPCCEKVRLEKAKQELHPYGSCICAGEGKCQWCKGTAILERRMALEALLERDATQPITHGEVHDLIRRVQDLDSQLSDLSEHDALVRMDNVKKGKAIDVAMLHLERFLKSVEDGYRGSPGEIANALRALQAAKG